MMQPADKEALDAPHDDDYPELERAHGVDHNGVPLGMWRESLWGCCGSFYPNALMSLVCPCVAVAQICHRLGFASYRVLLAVFGGTYCLLVLCSLLPQTGSHVVAVLLALGLWINLYRLRARLRLFFHVPGSMLGDGCSTLLCHPCAIAQLAAHINSFDRGTCSFRAKSVLPGYHI
ncbi:transmembrane protein [Achlya hypogyna]|uniref:Transmembrane protein n=1 Tax=Achlya hypogyna TaxID=1202772 RepID=A0A1V9YK14_ACHHY|nr:transmembrane protein [Achlya hypogyna]